MRRTTIASLLAPLWGPAVAATFAVFFWYPSEIATIDRGSWIALATAFGVLYGYAAFLVVGLPAHFVLQRHGHRSVWAYLATFFACELVIWALVYTASYASVGLAGALSILADTVAHRPYRPVFFGIIGAAIGGTFWMIARPDRRPLSSV